MVLRAEIAAAERAEYAFFQAEAAIQVAVSLQAAGIQQVIRYIRYFQASQKAGVFLEKTLEGKIRHYRKNEPARPGGKAWRTGSMEICIDWKIMRFRLPYPLRAIGTRFREYSRSRWKDLLPDIF